MRLFHKVVLAALFPVAAASTAGAAVVDFNTAGDLANNFNIPAAGWTQVAAGGVSGSGSVNTNGAADTTADYKTAFTLGATGNPSVTISALFTKANSSLTVGNRLLHMGIATSGTAALFTDGTVSFVSARINNLTGATATYEIQTQTRDGSGGGTVNGTVANGGDTSPFALLDNEFYQFSQTITQTGASTFSITASVTDFGSDGATPGATIATLAPFNITDNAVAAAAALFTGFRSNGANTFGAGLTSLDNFSVSLPASAPTPEPATLATLALSTTLLLRRRRA